MKIIKESMPWWAGFKFTCTCCGLEGELEAKDREGSFWSGIEVMDGGPVVTIFCPGCNGLVNVQKPSEPYVVLTHQTK